MTAGTGPGVAHAHQAVALAEARDSRALVIDHQPASSTSPHHPYRISTGEGKPVPPSGSICCLVRGLVPCSLSRGCPPPLCACAYGAEQDGVGV